MERVLGIGGLFFTAENPDALSRWYSEHLGVDPVPQSYDDNVWYQVYPNGRFAQLHDPEGNAIQLWEPT